MQVFMYFAVGYHVPILLLTPKSHISIEKICEIIGISYAKYAVSVLIFIIIITTNVSKNKGSNHSFLSEIIKLVGLFIISVYHYKSQESIISNAKMCTFCLFTLHLCITLDEFIPGSRHHRVVTRVSGII